MKLWIIVGAFSCFFFGFGAGWSLCWWIFKPAIENLERQIENNGRKLMENERRIEENERRIESLKS